MDWIQIVIGIFGGLGIFLYGMYLASEGLKRSASQHLKEFLKKVTKNQVYGSGAGVVLAAGLQSSSAATVMVVGFVNSGLMTLRQSMGVVLGSAIGTTLTVQLIAFKITDYALVFVGLGVLLFLVSSNQKFRYVGSILLGFGFVFFGMGMMTETMGPVQESPQFLEWFLAATDQPIFTVLIATLFTAIIQNSAATIAIAMTLAVGGTLTLESSLAIVYGANIGTVVTALISSLNASRDSQRTAVAHALFKIIGVLFFLPFTILFVQVLQSLGGTVERQIANAHTIFNIVNLLILLPFCNLFADWMTKLLKDKPEMSYTKYLDKNSLDFPTVAILNVQKELQRMSAKIKQGMFDPLLETLNHDGAKVRLSIVEEEKKIDRLYRGIYHYLKNIAEKDLTDQESRDSVQMLYVNNELEGVSDSLEQLGNLTIKFENGESDLSETEKKAIEGLYEEVYLSFCDSVVAFESRDKDKAMEVIHRNPKIVRLEKELRYQHFCFDGVESSRRSAVYTDVMNGLLKINYHCVNISQTMLGRM